MTQCVILANGPRASRSNRLDEPLRETVGRPFLDGLIDEIARFGIDDFLVLAAGAAAPSLRGIPELRQARDGRALTITTIAAPSRDKAGDLGLFFKRLHDTFLLVGGDTFFDCNITRLLQPAIAPDRMLRLAVCRDFRTADRVTVALEGDRVVGMNRECRATKAAWVSAGICYMRKKVISSIGHAPSSLEADILPRALKMGVVEARCFEGGIVNLNTPAGAERPKTPFPIWRGAVFFDRDGVLNEDSGYIHQPHELRWLPGARECIRAVNDSGRFAFVVTNQSGIARGYYDETAICAFHAEMQRQLLAVGAHIDAFVFCPHHPDGILPKYARHCDCRKPLPGMILKLLNAWPVRRRDSILIGDRPSDIAAAEAAGIAGRRYDGGDLREVL